MIRGGNEGKGGQPGRSRIIDPYNKGQASSLYPSRLNRDEPQPIDSRTLLNLDHSPDNFNPPLRLNLLRNITFPTPLF
jgi:hypothetical protein